MFENKKNTRLAEVVSFDSEIYNMRGKFKVLSSGEEIEFRLIDGFSPSSLWVSRIPKVGDVLRFEQEIFYGWGYPEPPVSFGYPIWTYESEWKSSAPTTEIDEEMPQWRQEILNSIQEEAHTLSESSLLAWEDELDDPYSPNKVDPGEHANAAGITVGEIQTIIRNSLRYIPPPVE